MEKLRPNGQRAKNAVLMIWIVMAMSVIMLISSLIQYRILSQMNEGVIISPDEIETNDLRVGFILILYGIVYLISGVTFIQWFRRAYYNLHQRMSHLSHSEEWAAISWFVPIVNFFRPYNIMVEIYRETKKLLQYHQIRIPNNMNRNIVGWWWALWIFTGIVAYITRNTGTMDDVVLGTISVENLMDDTLMEMLAAALEIPLAIITVGMIKQYAAVEPLLNEIDVEPKSVKITE